MCVFRVFPQVINVRNSRGTQWMVYVVVMCLCCRRCVYVFLIIINYSISCSWLLRLLSFVVIKFITWFFPASFMKICHRSNPNLNECIKESLESMKPFLDKGNYNYNLLVKVFIICLITNIQTKCTLCGFVCLRPCGKTTDNKHITCNLSATVYW